MKIICINPTKQERARFFWEMHIITAVMKYPRSKQLSISHGLRRVVGFDCIGLTNFSATVKIYITLNGYSRTTGTISRDKEIKVIKQLL